MKAKTETTTASLAVVGVDIGKEVFHLVGLNTDGTIAFRRKIRRSSLKDVFEQLPPCVVGMEACLSAHFVSRTITTMLRRWPRQRCGRTSVWSRKRAKTSSTYRHAIVSDPDWCPDGRRRSTRSEPF